MGRRGGVAALLILRSIDTENHGTGCPALQLFLACGAIQDKNPDRILVRRSRDGRGGAVAVLWRPARSRNAPEMLAYRSNASKPFPVRFIFSEMIQNGHAKRQQPIGLPAWD